MIDIQFHRSLTQLQTSIEIDALQAVTGANVTVLHDRRVIGGVLMGAGYVPADNECGVVAYVRVEEQGDEGEDYTLFINPDITTSKLTILITAE